MTDNLGRMLDDERTATPFHFIHFKIFHYAEGHFCVLFYLSTSLRKITFPGQLSIAEPKYCEGQHRDLHSTSPVHLTVLYLNTLGALREQF
jgi:hypothetical protein